MNVSTKIALGLLFSLALFASVPARADIPVTDRALIVISNLSSQGAPILRGMYRAEEWKAVRVSVSYSADSYRQIRVIYPQEATRENFLNAIEDFELDTTVQAIDVIVYLHGKREKLCFMDTPDCYSMSDLARDVRELRSDAGEGPRKLRALYSDACWGKTHNDEWIQAGFKVVAGAVDQDANKTIDLKKFLRAWTAGSTYRRAIQKANSAWYAKPLDWFIGGNSRKVMSGRVEMSIDSHVD